MRWIHVAEKPSAADAISQILSYGNRRRRQGVSKFNCVWDFDYKNVQMSFTSVSGHLMEMDFDEKYRNWHSIDPVVLFDAETKKFVKEENQPLADNLTKEARGCDKLVLWLDCDREGENIAFEVMNVIQSVFPRISVARARFSDFTQRSIVYAMDHLSIPNERDHLAVETRREIDLRLGAIFTRFQSMRIQSRFSGFGNKVVSYGPCQFPTLGFIVDRYNRVTRFVPESYWAITCSVKRDKDEAAFTWQRRRLFDKTACILFYEKCIQNPLAKVLNVSKQEKRRWSPIPMNTIALTKLASSKLRIDSHTTMNLAEKLYNAGVISYPRTETDSFAITDQEIQALMTDHASDARWGAYVTGLLNGSFTTPKKGTNDDHAHPPIHPTKYVNDLQGDEAKIYDLICRHFFACCSKDAIGHETIIQIDIAREIFTCQGSVLTERNYLDIYPWDHWYNKTIPKFEKDETFTPTSLLMKEDKTSAPSLLTETALITLMDQNQIGTDATIAQHIKTILDREYIVKNGQIFEPTKLGIALIEAYNEIGFKLSQPHLRGKIEQEMKLISLGRKSKEIVLMETLQLYKSVYLEVVRKAATLDLVMKKYFSDIETTVVQEKLSRCKCGSWMNLVQSEEQRFVKCRDHGTLPLPKNGDLVAKDHTCPICRYQVIQVGTYMICPWCFNNPPQQDIENVIGGNFRCFQCTEKKCSLAQQVFGKCSNCNEVITLRKNPKKDKSWFLGCRGYPNCNYTIWLPSALSIELSTTCRTCKNARISFKFEEGSMPPHIPSSCETCIVCEDELAEFIQFPKRTVQQVQPTVQPPPKRVVPESILSIQQQINKKPTNMNNIGGTGDQVQCKCGKNAPVKVSKKEQSAGREFYTCASTPQCGFFQWK